MATYEYLNATGVSELVENIKAKYAAKAEIPTKVSDLTNDSNYQTDTQVSTAIAAAIAGVTEFDYQIVQALPASGIKGVIYLVPNTGAGDNIYDEFIWIEVTEGTTTTGRFEKFGEKRVEAVEYVGDNAYVEIVDGSGDNTGKKVVKLNAATAASLALADTAVQGITSTGSTIEISGAGSTKNAEVASEIVSGAAAGATATQPSDFGSISNDYIDSLFA